jgi:predicted metal-dependent hydrolase
MHSRCATLDHEVRGKRERQEAPLVLEDPALDYEPRSRTEVAVDSRSDQQTARGADDAAIPVRQPAMPLSRDIPRHWYGGEAFASHFMDALSSTFPAGEAFFVRSVLHYRDRVDDPQLLADIRGFAGQEGQHSRVHADHLQLLLDQGYGLIENRNRLGDRIMRWFNRRQPEASIALTASLEHLTAILARQLLMHPERFTETMHPEMRALWRWHALEEAEHKSVAFDVMERAALRSKSSIASSTCSTRTESYFDVRAGGAVGVSCSVIKVSCEVSAQTIGHGIGETSIPIRSMIER